jgi:Tetratricopeptide repeat
MMLALVLALLQFDETITVARYILMARVVDSRGAAIRDLKPSEITVDIGGQRAEVESIEWIEPAKREEGRLIVFFIGTDFAKNASRMAGQLRFNAMAGEILQFLGPNDRAAVFSYDSHLKLRADFTRDRAVVAKAIRDSIGSDRVPLPVPHADGPSLVGHLDERVMRTAPSMETALLQVAEAMNAIEGERILIIAGYGMGTRQGPRVVLDREWHTAMALLQRMGAAVVSLNTGVGGELSLGLIATSKITNGIYAFTQSFPRQSVQKVEGMLAGRYELVTKTSKPLEPGRHAMEIRVTRRDTNVLAPPIVMVEPNEELDLVITEEKQNRAGFDLFLHALRRLQAGEEEGVEGMLDRVIALEPSRAEAWLERGLMRAGRGDNEGAIEDLKKYLELDPNGSRAREARELLRALQDV